MDQEVKVQVCGQQTCDVCIISLMLWCSSFHLGKKKSKTKRLLLILLLFYELLLSSYMLRSVICSLSIFIMTSWKTVCYVQCM